MKYPEHRPTSPAKIMATAIGGSASTVQFRASPTTHIIPANRTRAMPFRTMMGERYMPAPSPQSGTARKPEGAPA